MRPSRPASWTLLARLLVVLPAVFWPAVGAFAEAPTTFSFPSNQPFAHYWFPNDLLTWTPGGDAADPFNRSAVPLADRFADSLTQVNPHARAGEARVTAISIMYPTTSNNPSQGSLRFDGHTFGFWQYVEELVFWGGSAGEGLILVPNSEVIDAAHRNGVPVLGTIFFPPNVFGGQISWVQDLVQKSGADFPIADKLIEIADYYGFDGWFLNQETAGGDSALAIEMRDFLAYYQANKTAGQRMMWYDAMTEAGAIAWQNELNTLNDMFFEDGARVSDDVFLNFNWGGPGNRLAMSRARALALGRDPYEVYAGINVQADGFNVNPDWSALFPESAVHTVSLGFFGGEWPYASAATHYEYLTNANVIWVGQNRDPSNTTTTATWKGTAHYVPARSVLNDIPFTTSFNNGQGHFYGVDGAVLGTSEWTNRGLQDVLPTWRWIVEGAGPPVHPELDWNKAYEGGASLRITGDLDGVNPSDVRLFKTQFMPDADDSLFVIYKTGSAGTPSNLSVGYATSTSPATTTFLAAGTAAGAGWNRAAFSLAGEAGNTIVSLSVRAASNAPESGYEVRIGQLGIVDGPVDVPGAPSAATVSDFATAGPREGSARLTWTESPDPTYSYYVYQRNPDSTRSFLGGTSGTALFLPRVTRIANETQTTIEVEAVSAERGRSTAATTTVSWGALPANEDPIAHANGPYVAEDGVALSLSSERSIDPEGAALAYEWAFGDGDSAFSENPTHTYSLVDSYTVVLAVTDTLGAIARDTTLAYVVDSLAGPRPDVLWYQLDENGGAFAYDSSGNAYDGSVIEATWAPGILGSAVSLDGDSDYVLLNNYVKPDTLMTVMAWAYAGSRPLHASIAKNWGGGAGGFQLGLYENQGDLEMKIGEADGDVVTAHEGYSSRFPLASWQHVALVADGSLARLYRNGVEVACVAYDGALKTNRKGLGIGMRPNNAGTTPNNTEPAYWDGRIDDVRIYGRALGQNEIAALYEFGITTVVEEGGVVPRVIRLEPNAPNPFNPTTRIEYALPHGARVDLSIYDLRGRLVRTLVHDEQSRGRYSVFWRGKNESGRDVASGVYFYRLDVNGEAAVRKMMLIR